MSPSWHLIIYRLPTNPSRTRVAVWRELRRLGALPLQQSVSAIPDLGDLVTTLDAIEARMVSDGGSVYRFVLSNLTDEQRTQLEQEWTALREHEFAEIIEECQTKFIREIEFEIFRNNLTASEAEEIEADLDKIRMWFERVAARDWFSAANHSECQAAIAECERRLDEFIERVYVEEMRDGPSTETPAQMCWHDSPRSITSEETDPAHTDKKRSSQSQGSM